MSYEDGPGDDALEIACIALFKAIMKTGQEVLNHSDFHFRIDCTLATRNEDAERVTVIHERLQKALDLAKTTVTPKTIDGTSVQ